MGDDIQGRLERLSQSLMGLPPETTPENPRLIGFTEKNLGAPIHTDLAGNTHPGDTQFGPSHMYVGNIRPGRWAWMTNGKKVRVVSQSRGSTEVEVKSGARDFHTAEGEHVKFSGGTNTQTIARGTVVRFTKDVEGSPRGIVGPKYEVVEIPGSKEVS